MSATKEKSKVKRRLSNRDKQLLCFIVIGFLICILLCVIIVNMSLSHSHLYHQMQDDVNMAINLGKVISSVGGLL